MFVSKNFEVIREPSLMLVKLRVVILVIIYGFSKYAWTDPLKIRSATEESPPMSFMNNIECFVG